MCVCVYERERESVCMCFSLTCQSIFMKLRMNLMPLEDIESPYFVISAAHNKL